MKEAKSGIYLLLGGNLGNVVDRFREAEKMLQADLKVQEKSSLYETEPWGMESEHRFINQVWRVATSLSPFQTLEKILKVEQELGRERKFSDAYEDRPIDIDILLFEDLIINEEGLEIPHPRMHLRAFTLIPLLELNSELTHPKLKKPFESLLMDLPTAELNLVKRIG